MASEERRQQLLKLIQRTHNLINAFQNQLITSQNPKEEYRLNDDIEQAQKQLEGFEAELAALDRPASSSRPALSPTESPTIAGRQLKVFLCYSEDNFDEVLDLYRRLKDSGVAPWVDEEDLLPGQDWRLTTLKALRTSDVVLVCLSQNWIQKAGKVWSVLRQALKEAENQPEGAIFVIPVKLEECDVPEGLSQQAPVKLFDEQRGYSRLMAALQARATALATAAPTQTAAKDKATRPPESGDKIDARGSQGFVNQPTAPVTQSFSGPVHLDMRQFSNNFQPQGDVKVSETFNFSGDFKGAILNVKSTLNNTTQSIGAIPNAQPDEKEKLTELVNGLSKALEQVSPDKAKEAVKVAKRADELVKEATDEDADKEGIEGKGNTLLKAAQNLGEVVPVVLPIAQQIVSFIGKLFP